MNLRAILTAVLAAALAVAGVEAYHRYTPGQTMSSREDIQRIVREYLIEHPEVLQEASEALDKAHSVAEQEKAKVAIKSNADAIFSSPRQVTLGNPQGDVTLVEFFDYNCGYCKRALDDMLELMKADAKLRVVLKEWPVLGQGSIEAAQVAVAARMQDPGGEKYLAFHQALLHERTADKARALAAAQEAGFDMERLQKDLESDEVTTSLKESFKLAEQLGMNGTPSYVVGNEVVGGAVGLAALKDKVRTARCAVTTSC